MKLPSQSILTNYILSAIILITTVLAIGWYGTERFSQFFIAEQQNALASRAITVRQANQKNNQINCNVLQQSDPDIRVTIVAQDGTVKCDSNVDASTMENHAHRPEIEQALQGKRGTVIRFSHTVKTSMLYVAIPYTQNKYSQATGVVRTSVSLSAIENLLNELYQQFAWLMLVLISVIFVVILNVYKKINQPLAQIIDVAKLYAKGDFDRTLPKYDITEIKAIANALNQMATQLNSLEHMRQEFVSNVSHELKTPIATIKSYAETLLDGAQHDAKDVSHFLTIIGKQNDRLAAIVDDLLMLSRLENAPQNQLLKKQTTPAHNILKQAVDICQARAKIKNINISLTTNEQNQIKVDHSLMLQAVVNLIDNAIKYSPQNSKITISESSQNQMVSLHVMDNGIGIEQQHIDRLFERFYRVDKSRSRQAGGTGLGLAIVKHIVQIHKGNITVANNGGAGCTFSIHLPKAP